MTARGSPEAGAPPGPRAAPPGSHNGGMTPDEDTIPRSDAPVGDREPAAAGSAGPPESGDALEDTLGRADLPAGRPFDAPPPVRLAAPPRGPAMTVLNRVRVGDAVPVVLAVPVVVGRAPGVPRIGAPVVRVPVPSPRLQISADHLEIAQHGTTVVLRDLRSTNGSTILVPGRPPRLLARSDSAAVPVGTVVDLGEGVRIEILGPAGSPEG